MHRKVRWSFLDRPAQPLELPKNVATQLLSILKLPAMHRIIRRMDLKLVRGTHPPDYLVQRKRMNALCTVESSDACSLLCQLGDTLLTTPPVALDQPTHTLHRI